MKRIKLRNETKLVELTLLLLPKARDSNSLIQPRVLHSGIALT